MNRDTEQFLQECKDFLEHYQNSKTDVELGAAAGHIVEFDRGYCHASIVLYKQLILMLETGILRLKRGSYR